MRTLSCRRRGRLHTYGLTIKSRFNVSGCAPGKECPGPGRQKKAPDRQCSQGQAGNGNERGGGGVGLFLRNTSVFEARKDIGLGNLQLFDVFLFFGFLHGLLSFLRLLSVIRCDQPDRDGRSRLFAEVGTVPFLLRPHLPARASSTSIRGKGR